MASPVRNITIIGSFMTVILSAFACAPFYSNSRSPASLNQANQAAPLDKAFQPRPAKLSGVLTLKEGCSAGYYQVKLQGLFEGAATQVESQTDQSGRFQMVAPPGQYMMVVQKEECGSRERIVLEENTEHMLEVTVQETKRVEKTGKIRGRLPASILVPRRS